MGAMKPTPTGALVEAGVIQVRSQFDATPFANLSLMDVARILDTETAKTTLDVDTVGKLIDRVISGLQHTLVATSGRPQGMRLAKLLARGLNRLLTRMPEFAPVRADESLARLRPVLTFIENAAHG